MIRLKLLLAGMAILGAAQSGAAQAAEPVPAGFELALVDLQGQKKVLGKFPGSVYAPRVSPDGRRVAFEVDEVATADSPAATRLYVAELADLAKRRPLQLTVTSRRNVAPVWSADGDWIAFVATGNAADALFIQRSDGWIQPKYLTDGRAVEGFYKDGTLTFLTLKGERDYGIAAIDMSTRKVRTLVDQPGSAQHSGRISPDGQWIAYVSDETGRQEVWVEPLPQTGQRFQLTRNGGRHPVWSPDGTKLYFDLDGRMYRLDVTLGAAGARAGEPAVLPISGFHQTDGRRRFDLMPDGQSFLMLFPSTAP